MISTLRKMPWYMIDQITVFQRYSVYDATVRLIQSLQKQINYKNNIYLLNKQLLERLWTSAMLCHGFSVTQKYNIAYCVNLSDERMRDFNMPRFPEDWVHTHTLVPKPGTPLDVLEVSIRYSLCSVCLLFRVRLILTICSAVVYCYHPRDDHP